ncbi:hypothetical protein ABK040_009907 [Willaertia magna]
MNQYFQGVRIDNFKRQYRTYTGAFCSKPQIDEGGKIILPASALDELVRLNIVYPMLFKITNPKKGKYVHCGVLEFVAEEGRAYIPFWMQEHLQLSPGQLVTIENATLPKGTFVKIRPQQKAFIEISDPKAVLEKQLRNFSCLTKGDTIIIHYNNKQYCIDIVEVASASGSCDAVSIVETDVKVEFERPADMPPSPIAPVTPSAEELFGKSNLTPPKDVKKEEPKQPEKFVGTGRRLDGKEQKSSTATTTSNVGNTTSVNKPTTTSSTSSSSSTPPIVGKKRKTFGEAKDKDNKTQPSSTTPPKDEKKFVAFGGSGRTLK